jgi:hypothetical protein
MRRARPSAERRFARTLPHCFFFYLFSVVPRAVALLLLRAAAVCVAASRRRGAARRRKSQSRNALGMADAAPPPAPARAGPVAALSALLAPAGPDAATVLALVPALRTALAASLPPGTLLWGTDLLDADDPAGVTVLGKCVAAPRARRRAVRRSTTAYCRASPALGPGARVARAAQPLTRARRHAACAQVLALARPERGGGGQDGSQHAGVAQNVWHGRHRC